jgi:hypothetical protein
MRNVTRTLAAVAALGTLTFTTSIALAGDEAPAGGDKPADAAAGADVKAETPVVPKAGGEVEAKAGAKPAAPKADVDEDEPRFRGGISGGGGGFFIEGVAGGIGGLDGRLGVQINDLIGVYAQPQLGIYGVTLSGFGTGIGGMVAGTVAVDFTFIDQIFVGVGGGGGILNNPAAGELLFRAGGYPLIGFGDDGIRRKGLMLSADVRVFFVSGGLTVVSPTVNIGYEAF